LDKKVVRKRGAEGRFVQHAVGLGHQVFAGKFSSGDLA
jgi:hypothetical protein